MPHSIRKISEDTEEHTDRSWSTYKDLQLHDGLFKKGIVAVRAYSSTQTVETSSIDLSGFILNSRELYFIQKAAPKKFARLLNQLQSFIGAYSTAKTAEPKDLIVNKQRRDEMFAALIFKKTIQDQAINLGLYIYPWLSGNNIDHSADFVFSGFKRFVMAGCMFGSTLKGIDQFGAKLDIIKHDIKFHPGQKIVEIEFNSKGSNPYEEIMFDELKKLMLFITKLSDPNSLAIKLYYHLPYYDYMLFGIELFLRGRMTLHALNRLFTEIVQKSFENMQKIQEIYQQYASTHKFECEIKSPFENLFGSLEACKPLKNLAENILLALGLPSIELDAELYGEDIIKKEQELVKCCLIKLQTVSVDSECSTKHQQAWQNFINIAGEDNINTLEDLFKIANAVMIAIASTGAENYKTCSLLPVSEKQIQVSYASFAKQKTADAYPGVFNITTLDPVMGYDHNSKGLLFYFGSCPNNLCKLITKQNILTFAHGNAARFAEQTEGLSVSQALKYHTRCSA